MLLRFGLPFGMTLILVALLMIFGIPFTDFPGSYGHERSEVLNTLSSVADLKKDRFKLWFEERKGDAQTLCSDVDVVSSVNELHAMLKTTMKPGTKTEELRSTLTASGSFRHLVQHLRMAKRIYRGYQKIQVADAGTGLILASTDEQDVLQRVSRKMLPVDDPTVTDRILADVEKDPEKNTLFMTISDAIVDRSSENESRNKDLARLILYIDTAGFVKPMLYTGLGLGQTGEIVLVNEAGQILMPLKYPLADGSTATPLVDELVDQPVKLALAEQEGIMVSDDYRGVPVLAAFRHIKVGPNVEWGMVVKRDQAEVLAPAWEGLFYSALIGILGLIATGVSAAAIANRLSRSIQGLTRTAQSVATGNLGVRAPPANGEEMADLIAAFNRMIGRLEHRQKGLEGHIALQRTRLTELTTEWTLALAEQKQTQGPRPGTEEWCRFLFDECTDAVLMVHAEGEGSGEIVYANRVAAEIHGCTQDALTTRRLDDLSGFEAVRRTNQKVQALETIGNATEEDLYRERGDLPLRLKWCATVVNPEGHKYFIDIGKRTASRGGTDDTSGIKERLRDVLHRT